MSKTQQNKQQGGPPTKEQNKINPNLIVRVISAYIYKDYEVKGKMDPYIKLKLGNLEYQTGVATDQGQNPKWGDDATFSFFHTKEDKLIVELWEDDVETEDDYLGTVEIIMKDLIANKNQQGEKKYIAMDGDQKMADIVLNISYDSTNQIDAQKNQQQIADAQLKAQQINDQNKSNRKSQQLDKAQNVDQISKSQVVNDSQVRNKNPNIVVQVLSARIDQNFEEEGGKMDPYFIMKMGNQEFRTTTATDQGQNPKWKDGAKFGFLRTNENKIVLELWEDDEKSADDYLGLAQVDINELLSKQPPQNQYIIYDKNGDKIGDVQLLIQIDMNSMDKNQNQNANQNKNASQVGKTNLSQKQINIQPLTSLGIQKLDASRTISKDELAQKTKEIQDRLNNIQVKLRPQPLVTYIEDNVHKALLEGMKKLAKERPTNPIRELGMFLVNYEETSTVQRQNQN